MALAFVLCLMPGPRYWQERLQLNAERGSEAAAQVSGEDAEREKSLANPAKDKAVAEHARPSATNIRYASTADIPAVSHDHASIRMTAKAFLSTNVKTKERLGHFIPMAGIGFCLTGLFRQRKVGVLKSISWTLVTASGIALLIELLQELVPESFHRGFALDDIGVSLAGGLAGAGLVLIARRGRICH